jgi:hypothetical protein
MTVHAHNGWRIVLPDGLVGGPVLDLTNPELTSIAVYRGHIEDAPAFAAVSVRPLAGSLRSELRSLTRFFFEEFGEGTPVPVPGSRGARRVDGFSAIEEGYGDPPGWVERLTIIAAKRRKELVVLTVRRHGDAEIDAAVDGIVASFAITS